MSFNWTTFLERYHIPYVTSGPNIARGNVGIKCPWCGDADTSQHMGISLRGDGYGCWRNKEHRGKNPVRLIKALLNCSYDEAQRIAGRAVSGPTVSDHSFGDHVAALLNKKETREEANGKLEFPPEIKPLIRDKGIQRRFIDYLVERDYTRDDAMELCEMYDLHYAMSGPFKLRIIVPIYMRQGLVNWTGRAITEGATLRYRTLSADAEKAKASNLPVAPVSIDKTLFNFRELAKARGRKLLVLEGPFDALRVDYFGRSSGLRATCLFGTGNLSREQVSLLEEISSRYDERIMVLDRDASLTAVQYQSRLEYLRFKFSTLPSRFKDPAVLSRKNVAALFD